MSVLSVCVFVCLCISVPFLLPVGAVYIVMTISVVLLYNASVAYVTATAVL